LLYIFVSVGIAEKDSEKKLMPSMFKGIVFRKERVFMQKFFFTLFMSLIFTVFVSNQVASATSLSVVLDTPAGYFSEPEKVYETVQKSLDKIFKGAPFEVKSVSECDAYVQIYREENGLAGASDTEDGGKFNRDLTFKKADLAKMCDYFQDKNLVYIRVSTTDPRHTGGIFTSGVKINVILDFRIWDNEKKDFVYIKRATTKGGSDTVNLGGIFGRGSGSTENAVEEGLKKGLKEIEKDKAKIVASIAS